MTAKTYDRQTAKFLAVLGENMPELSGDVMQGWIQNTKGLQKVLYSAFFLSETTHEFKVFKTIKLGTGLKTADEFRGALKSNDFHISNWVNDILGKPEFSVSKTETEVDLVVVSVAELGFKDGAIRKDIYERAIQLGLELCPTDVGPQLRLQYKDQPMGEWLLIGMEPIAGSDGGLSVFSVARHGDGLWLGGLNGRPGSFWRGYSRWVFLRRK